MIIGIGHVARTGKDTAASALVRDLGYRRTAFADGLKALAVAADPLAIGGNAHVNTMIGKGHLAWLVKGVGWERAKDEYPEVRRFLQELGLGVRQVLGEDVWVRAVVDRIRPNENVVIPDVRFQNEADAIQALGGLVLRLNRPGHRPQGHVSETALANWSGWDHEIDNSGSIQDLEAKIVDYVSSKTRVTEGPTLLADLPTQ